MQPPMTFSMPMFNDFVPEKIRPWIYLCIAMCFQLSGARYLGPLNEIIGADGLMREDILMCMYCNLAGMALWFPMLFRMKFRFSNKQLLTAASITVIITNLLTAYVTFLPLLWFICFVEGIAKIQGTFECMSNIQLWMTPKRDMKIFFPILHVVILSAIAFQDLLSSYFGYLGDWRLMHYFVIGLQCIVLLILTTCVHHFKFTNQPLYGIDWTSMVLWAVLMVLTAFMLDYGEHYDWFHSKVIWYLLGFIIITFSMILWRMNNNRHPYISPNVFTKFKFVKPIFILIMIYEAVMGTEYVLEEVFLEEGLDYGTLTNSALVWPVWIGNISGCAIAFLWMQIVNLFPRGVCDFDVFQGNARIEYSSVVPAVNLPWRGVCVPKHNVYGFAARLYGFSAFFPRTDGFQRFAYGNRRLHRLRVLLQRSQLLRCRGGKKFFGLRRKNLYVYGRKNALRLGGVCVHRIVLRLLMV